VWQHLASPGIPARAADYDIMINDWWPSTDPAGTYWAVHNWNQDSHNGAGYAGYQVHADGVHTVHFALWDPVVQTPDTDEAKAEYVAPGSKASRFGNEGTGVKVSTDYPWQVNHWYTMVVRTWQGQDAAGKDVTKYGQWVLDQSTGEWLLTAVLTFPDTGLNFDWEAAFTEDYTGHADQYRQSAIKAAYARDADGWHALTQRTYRSTGATSNWYAQVDPCESWGTCPEDIAWTTTGGWFGNLGTTEVVYTARQAPQPVLGRPAVTLKANRWQNTVAVSWTATGTPQFSARLELTDWYGKVVQSVDLAAYETSWTGQVSLPWPQVARARLVYTDIFDQTVTATAWIM
jgi:hypothetical protein